MAVDIGMSLNGVEVLVSDFHRGGRDLRDWIAFSIASVANTHCRDKDALLDMLYYEADRIIEQVGVGHGPD